MPPRSHFEYTIKIHEHLVCLLCRYVVEKDVENNVVFVSRNYFSVDKRRRQFRVGSLRWFSGSPPRQVTQIQCKVFISVCIINYVEIPSHRKPKSHSVRVSYQELMFDCKWMLLKDHVIFYAFEWCYMKLQLSIVLFSMIKFI